MQRLAPHVWPALTPSERLHLDVYGYVVVESVLSPSEVAGLVDALYSIEERYHATGEVPANSVLESTSPDYFRIDNIAHVGEEFLSYLTHPRLLGMAEDAVGGDVRLEQSDAHIRRPVEGATNVFGFHRGSFAGFSYAIGGLYHYPFVKTLTNLTDLGPNDGGTTVIAGTHKMPEVPDRDLIEAASDDPRLVHHVEAPAGSTLLFFESLMHSSGFISSSNDRLLVIGGYTPTMFQPWHYMDPPEAFVESLPEELRPVLDGRQRWHWQPRARSLGDRPADGPIPRTAAIDTSAYDALLVWPGSAEANED